MHPPASFAPRSRLRKVCPTQAPAIVSANAATATGFAYDREMTRPNRDIFNCDPRNAFDLPGFP